MVHADRGQRTLKFHQLLDERLTLASDERAVLTVLLLRGPQTPGELKSRTDRLHRFADRDETEAVLHRLAGRTSRSIVDDPREADNPAARRDPLHGCHFPRVGTGGQCDTPTSANACTEGRGCGSPIT